MRPRILFLADIKSPHTQKWALGLAEENFEIGIFSFNHSDLNWLSSTKNIVCLSQAKIKQSNTTFSKLKYLLFLLRLFIIILKFKPNAIHAHYVSSYGFLGALTLYKPLIISAWGSDLTEFPKKNLLNKWVIKFVFWRADKICVSSTILEKEIKKYSNKSSIIIPFGVDLTTFYKSTNNFKKQSFTFGCVKQFEKNYNIDKVIQAFGLLTEKYPDIELKLKLVGDGNMKLQFFSIAKQLGIVGNIEFTGWVEHQFIPLHLNTIDALVNVSEYESFGVSVAEAMACKIPVIISKAEGFKDLVPDDENAFIASSNTPIPIFEAMESCLFNVKRRNVAIEKSYLLISEKFDWVNNLTQMKNVYLNMIHAGLFNHSGKTKL